MAQVSIPKEFLHKWDTTRFSGARRWGYGLVESVAAWTGFEVCDLVTLVLLVGVVCSACIFVLKLYKTWRAGKSKLA